MPHISPPEEEEEEERKAPATAARPAFLCKHCPKEYTSLGALKMHIRSHTLPCTHAEVKKYQCGVCSRTFSRMSLLQKHSSSGCCSSATVSQSLRRLELEVPMAALLQSARQATTRLHSDEAVPKT
ncbi:hypothetical protein F7725_016590 [Dissostichus mawsoni]|uniref:C2H2-type domain-containing protein n=1 Tax=Dissostichus mawsoni TaxID=36200 RepID=A0A7J5Z4Z7_DISMA|nr:hypothetical protein F7725_016590 [Dissostichus mawsoni]